MRATFSRVALFFSPQELGDNPAQKGYFGCLSSTIRGNHAPPPSSVVTQEVIFKTREKAF